MGLFSETQGYQRDDYNFALRACKRVARWWNYEHCQAYGFKLVVGAKNVDTSCNHASRLFDEEPHYFARNPSPFKRVAAFLVMGCLEPFLGFEEMVQHPNRREGFPESAEEKRAWRVRFLLMMLPELFSLMEVKVNDQWEKVQWSGFPSQHYRLEFMNWLKWLDGLSDIRDSVKDESKWSGLHRKRCARMVMGTALALEASSYCNPENPTGIQGKISGCMSNLNDQQNLDLYFHHLPGN